MRRREIWWIVLLVGGYVTFQLMADVAAAKIAKVGSITLPAGTFVFALTFTWRDMLHKKLGREWARAAIIVAGLANVFMMLYYAMAIHLEPAPFWPFQEAYAQILGVIPRITVASIIAEVISELVDTEVYHLLAPRFRGASQVVRVLGSNAIALPLDSAIFGTLAFAGIVPFMGIVSLSWGMIVYKGVVTMISLPGIFLVGEKPLEIKPLFA